MLYMGSVSEALNGFILFYNLVEYPQLFVYMTLTPHKEHVATRKLQATEEGLKYRVESYWLSLEHWW